MNNEKPNNYVKNDLDKNYKQNLLNDEENLEQNKAQIETQNRLHLDLIEEFQSSL